MTGRAPVPAYAEQRGVHQLRREHRLHAARRRQAPEVQGGVRHHQGAQRGRAVQAVGRRYRGEDSCSACSKAGVEQPRTATVFASWRFRMRSATGSAACGSIAVSAACVTRPSRWHRPIGRKCSGRRNRRWCHPPGSSTPRARFGAGPYPPRHLDLPTDPVAGLLSRRIRREALDFEAHGLTMLCRDFVLSDPAREVRLSCPAGRSCVLRGEMTPLTPGCVSWRAVRGP